MAAEPDFRARVELADRHGIPPSQLDGREPATVTTHEYDTDGLLVRSVAVAEARYTEQDRAELLALDAYRYTICPACGGPLDECTSHERDGLRFVASAVRCRRRDALAMSQDAKKDTDRPEALIWSVATVRR